MPLTEERVHEQTKAPTHMWLDTMRAEINAANTTEFQPNDKVAAHEKVVGTVPEPLQKIWALSQSYAKNCERLTHDMRWERDEKKIELLGGQCLEAHAISQCLAEIFWLEARRHFNLFTNPNDTVGIRQGWVLVTFNDPLSAMPDIMKMILSDVVRKRGHNKQEVN